MDVGLSDIQIHKGYWKNLEKLLLLKIEKTLEYQEPKTLPSTFRCQWRIFIIDIATFSGIKHPSIYCLYCFKWSFAYKCLQGSINSKAKSNRSQNQLVKWILEDQSCFSRKIIFRNKAHFTLHGSFDLAFGRISILFY